MKKIKNHNCKLDTCDVNEHSDSHTHSCCPSKKGKKDFLLYFSIMIISVAYFSYLTMGGSIVGKSYMFNEYVFNTMNKMWIGIALGIIFAGILSVVPQDFVVAAFGDRKSGVKGIVKASIAGVLVMEFC